MTDTPESPSFDFMPEAEDDLSVAHYVQRRKRRALFAGYSAGQLLAGAALVGAVVWGMWVTRAVTAPPQHIVKANLSAIVGDYVQAQARSASSPEEVQSQMRAFMASLDGELQRRSDKGQVVLVGEAVLSKGVEDITPQVMKAVYASGVKRPVPASPEQMSKLLQGELGKMEGAIPPVPVTQPAPAAAMPAPPAGGAGQFGALPDTLPDPGSFGPVLGPPPGAAVSSFGGGNGIGGQ